MKTTARFDVLRKNTLKNFFTSKNLAIIWKSIVKPKLRILDISDLHDYYDFDQSIKGRTKEIASRIIKGQYNASTPLLYRIEKKFGICRHLLIPNPADALVLQTIAEILTASLDKLSPTKRAFFSQDKHLLKSPHEFFEDKGYPWFILWPKFQKEILKFTKECPYLVVTDLTNFYDNIDIRDLRHIVSVRLNAEEVILDLVFSIIEQLSWTPDYLPSSFKGFPTVNLEVFWLLPHVMLFEIDEVLKKKTKNKFVRWMDDINFGAKSFPDACASLGVLNDILKSRGLALNLSKTKVYTSKQAQEEFLFKENEFLDELSSENNLKLPTHRTKMKFINSFRRNLKNTHFKNWDKVTKRYFTIAGRNKSKSLLKYAIGLYKDYPSIRNHILNYYYALGYSKIIAEHIVEIISNVKRYDDVSLFRICKLITKLAVPVDKSGKSFIDIIDIILQKYVSVFDLYCYFWFSAKYKSPYDITALIEKTKKRWMNDEFIGRQAVSLLPRIYLFKKDSIERLMQNIIKSGSRDAASVASNLHYLFSVRKLPRKLSSYLNPQKVQNSYYPLPKYLILTAVLSSPNLNIMDRKNLKARELITDPWYIKWLEEYDLL